MNERFPATIIAQCPSSKASREPREKRGATRISKNVEPASHQKRGVTRVSPHPKAQQLSLFRNPQPSTHLRIEPVCEALQWYREPRYWLTHEESGLRVPGTWSFEEAQIILHLSSGWDWTIDPPSRIPACQGQILALCEGLCKHEVQRQAKSYKDFFTDQLVGGKA